MPSDNTQYTDGDRAMALGGVFQACVLVRRIAESGQAAAAEQTACLETIFQDRVDTVMALYGSAQRFRLGLETLQALRQPATALTNRYVIGLLILERKLFKHPDKQHALRTGINTVAAQADYFNSRTHANVISALGQLYQDTISPLRPRILINGHALHLQNPANAAAIRALLLAGMRSAVLWRQTGGNRFKLLFGHNRLVNASRRLLAAPAIVSES